MNSPRLFIVYCSIAGFIASWAVTGLLVMIDWISNTPPGTFFAVIGISMGFSDPESAQYIGFSLHLLTGLTAGNILGQFALFWTKIAPFNVKRGMIIGVIAGILLWAVLFLPLTVFGIQPRLDSYAVSAPNQYIYNIANNFQGLFTLIVGGSFVFHIIYGIILGLIAGRMTELGVLSSRPESKQF